MVIKVCSAMNVILSIALSSTIQALATNVAHCPLPGHSLRTGSGYRKRVVFGRDAGQLLGVKVFLLRLVFGYGTFNYIANGFVCVVFTEHV